MKKSRQYSIALAAIAVLGFLVYRIATTEKATRDSHRPRISAFFNRIDDGPAFLVECRNATGEDVSSSADIWASSLRLDGTTVPDQPHMGPGLTTDVEPGQSWRGIVALRQSYRSFFPNVKFGALVRTQRVLPLS